MKTKIEELEKRLEEIQNELSLIKKQPTVQKYPKSEWIELWSNTFFTSIGGLDSKYLLFAALVETCKEWNRIDEFVPDWSNNSNKWCVRNIKNKIIVDGWLNTSHPIYLKDRDTAELFLDTYRTELEQVKHLL